MRLTDRDIRVIEYIDKFQGGTIKQLQLLFFPSYCMCKKRLKILKDNKFLKVSVHPIINKKVYYLKKVPSYHTLVLNMVRIVLSDLIVDFRREYKIDKYKVDALIITKKKQVIILEVDIFNKTSNEKVRNVKSAIRNKLGIGAEVIIITKEKRRSKGEWKEIKIEEIENIKYIL